MSLPPVTFAILIAALYLLFSASLMDDDWGGWSYKSLLFLQHLEIFPLPFLFHSHTFKWHLPFDSFSQKHCLSEAVRSGPALFQGLPYSGHREPPVWPWGQSCAPAIRRPHSGRASFSPAATTLAWDTQAHRQSSVSIWCLFFYLQESEVLVFCFLGMQKAWVTCDCICSSDDLNFFFFLWQIYGMFQI